MNLQEFFESGILSILSIIAATIILIPIAAIGLACLYEDYTKWRKGHGW